AAQDENGPLIHRRAILAPELRGFCFQRRNFLFQSSDLARLIVLALSTGEFLAQELELRLNDFQTLFCSAVHISYAPIGGGAASCAGSRPIRRATNQSSPGAKAMP